MMRGTSQDVPGALTVDKLLAIKPRLAASVARMNTRPQRADSMGRVAHAGTSEPAIPEPRLRCLGDANFKHNINTMSRHLESFFTLNEHNIDEVAKALRDLLVGHKMSVVSLRRCDAEVSCQHSDIECDAEIESSWTDGSREQIRVFKKGDTYTPKGEFADDPPRENHTTYVAFSMGDYFYTLNAAPEDSNSHEDFCYPYLRIVNRSDRRSLEWLCRAPAGAGFLHRHVVISHPIISSEKDEQTPVPV